MAISEPTTDHAEIQRWAEAHRIVPAIQLPEIIDHEPAILRLIKASGASANSDVRILAWDEFFAKFDELGLTLVYDSDPAGQSELLQNEAKSPYRSLVNRMPSLEN